MTQNGLHIKNVADRSHEDLTDLKFDLWSAVLHLLVSTFTEHEKSTLKNEVAKRLLLQYIVVLLFMEQFLNTGSQYQSGLLGHHTQPEGSTNLRPPLATLDIGMAGRAITYAFEFLKDKRTCCAVPAALCCSTCTSLNRLWLLEPLKKDSWRMINKARILTYISLKETGESLARIQNQKVYG